MRGWLREQGHQVSSRGKVPGALKEKYYTAYPDRRPPGSVALLPGPDDDSWDSDAGDYDVIGLAEPEPVPEPPRGPVRYEAVPDAPDAPVADPEPAHAGKEWRKQGRDAPRAPSGGRGTPRKVSVTVRTDISAKISLVLEVPGRVWQARDPVCGSAFIEQRPAIADALTEIVCNSPDLVAWFTGSGGQFMLWFNLVMAAWPVAMTVAAHHVYHTIEEMPGDATQPDYQDYAA